MKRIIVRAIIGAIPGLAMFLLAFPVSGEVELTLGDGGFLVALTGAFAGAIVGASKRRKG